MKKIFIAYLALSRPERAGFAALTGLMALLVLVWQTMERWLPGPADAAWDIRLEKAWAQYQATNPLSPPAEDRSAADGLRPAGALFTFDPNTLDSAGFLRLGLAPRVVKGLLNWRRHGKHFYRKEDLKPLYNLTPETYERLAPYISIAATERPSYARYSHLPPLPATIDLNTTDSATLVRLNGIGPVLAHRIIGRRTALGGFLRHEQLLEVCRFSDSTFTMLREKLIIRPEAVQRIRLNSASLEQLQAHPYIGEKMAGHIVQLRNGLHKFDNIGQLRQVPLMNEEIYRKIAPYFVID